MATEQHDLISRLSKLGFAPGKIEEISHNKKTRLALNDILDNDVKVDNSLDKTQTGLLQQLANLSKSGTIPAKRRLLTNAILDGRIKTNLQLDAGWSYIQAAGEDAIEEHLNEEAGVGKSVPFEQVVKTIGEYFHMNRDRIQEERYRILGTVTKEVKQIPELKWASAMDIKGIIDTEMVELLGPKDERDVVVKKKGKKDKKEATNEKETTFDPIKQYTSLFTEGWLSELHKAGENPQINKELMEQHLKATGGKVITRFPPEPNGYLHIGHSRAIIVNFGYAAFFNGYCNLRYDDTNPEAEEEEYFESILDIIQWLGFKPHSITYSSDNFDKLYQLAEQLIKRDMGYVCHCTGEEILKYRGGKKSELRVPCPHRNRPINESLEAFREMRDGKYEPGQAVLRMKQDLNDANPQMWDLIAYRVIKKPHFRTGDKWKIYPTYDFTHCLCDSIENITHSLCTLEFFLSRQSYEWLCDALEVYKPAQREYGRLNLTGTIMSKRKIAQLVNDGYVNGWDDPRLFTLVAIRRRGIPPGAVLSFVGELGVTTTNSLIQVSRFEQSIRKYLENQVARIMLVIDPILLILDNLSNEFTDSFECEYKKGNKELGSRKLSFSNKIYIDRSDFREVDSPDYFRLAPGKSVGLFKVPWPIKVTSFHKDPNTGLVDVIHAHYQKDESAKPKTYIHWINAKANIKLSKVNIFNRLFKSDNPSGHEDGFLSDINPNSIEIFKNAVIEENFINDIVEKELSGARSTEVSINKENHGFNGFNEPKRGAESVRFQALRVGYFCLDSDTRGDQLVLNRIVSLKEDSQKN